MKRLLGITLLLFTTVASATVVGDGECRGNCAPRTTGTTPNVTVTPNITPVISPVNINAPSSTSTSAATGGNQTQTATGGAGGAGGSAAVATSANAGATNQGVQQGVTINQNAPERVMTVGAAPDILTTPTAPCRIAVGVSGGWLGGALGFGTSVEDEGCTLRENARLLHNFGEKDAALKLMCNDEKVAAVLAVCRASAQPK